LGATGPDTIGHEQLHALAPARSSHPQTDAIEKQIPPVIRQARLMKLGDGLV
jgi:hypothetical protein